MRWIAVVVALFAAAPADAATVRTLVEDRDALRYTERHVTWTVEDRHGVDDRITVRGLSDGIEVRAARRLTAGHACSNRGARVVRCATPHRAGLVTILALGVDLADGDDRLALGGGIDTVARVKGGAGADLLDGRRASAAVRLAGGTGRDRLFGSPHDDELSGGRGADALHGGGGSDLASWRGTRPVRADLLAGTARSMGTIDRLTGIENLEAGSGRDDLRGDAGPNDLRGGHGADRIRGRAGDDRVDGEGAGGEDLAVDVVDGGTGDDWVVGLGGGDVLIGGAGDDLLRGYAQATSRRPSRARCGAGQDVVFFPRPGELVEPDCERIEFGSALVEVPPEVVADGWKVRVSYRCNAEPASSCRAAIALTDAGGSRTLGSTEVEVADGAVQTIDLHLTPEGLDEVRRRGSLLGRLHISSNDGNWADSPFGATLRLKAPG